MKKVKSIGKKVMSVGLAASLLLAPVSANKCSADIFNFNFLNRGQSQQGAQNQQAAQAGNQNAQQGAQNQQAAQAGNQNAQQGAQNGQAQQVNQGSSKVKDTLKKVGLAGAGIGIYVIIWLLLCNGAHNNYEGYSKIFNENKEAITNFWAAYGDEIALYAKHFIENGKCIGYNTYAFIKLICENLYDMGESAYNILDTIGFKNIFSVIGGLYLTNKLYNGTKWVCNKVAGLFRSKKNEQENKDNKGKPKQTGNINVNNVNVNNLNMNNLDEDWLNNNRDKLRKALGM